MTAPPRLCCLSIDLDEVGCYYDIHGLGEPAPEIARAIYARALPRHLEILDALEIPATLFAIGRDLKDPANAQALREAAAAGHEIANHTFSHRYDFVRLSDEPMVQEIQRGAEAIERAVGARPVGFRAPGYNVDDRVLGILRAQGYAYDSSVFPCPPYYLAKAAMLAWIRLRGRRSRSVLGSASVLSAPAVPYRASARYHRRGSGLAELPVATTPWLRMPFIGTTVVLFGAARAARMARRVARRGFVNLELHGIDLADAEADGLTALRAHQPDLRVPLERKKQALLAALQAIRAAGYRFTTTAEAARLLLPPG